MLCSCLLAREWCGSVDEKCAGAFWALSYGLPAQVVEAAVIGIPDVKWMERPLLVVVPHPKHTLSKDELLGFMKVPAHCMLSRMPACCCAGARKRPPLTHACSMHAVGVGEQHA
jgi:acyl-CoA synthetase (AMP-forming)/AMP-acid ligase II